MARRLTPTRRLTTAMRWPAGVGLTFWRYLWRTTPMRRGEEPGQLPEDAPPAVPADAAREEIQAPEQGFGPLFHRRYLIRIAGADVSPEELMRRFASDMNAVAPTEFARFHKLQGDENAGAQLNDEYLVRMPGPWDGPVRVVQTSPRSLRLATLEGHLEAGQIEFRSARDGELTFSIESWARSGDRFSNLLYHRLRVSKEVQLHMWTSLLERIVRLAGGRRRGAIEIRTRRVEGARGQRLLGDREARAALHQLHDRPLNFHLGASGRLESQGGWHVDDYRRSLPPEAPGPPQPGGSWETASRLMRDYEFADPDIVRAIYHPDAPLEGRDMLLEAHYAGMRFHLGVRVGGLVDETREVEGRPARVWGWSYRTLQGHLEMGQMDYELWKWLDDGAVEFRIHAVSRAAAIGNPVIRLGFRILGRGVQRRFSPPASDRMERRTRAEMERGAGAGPVPRASGKVTVQPASETARLGARMERQARAGTRGETAS